MRETTRVRMPQGDLTVEYLKSVLRYSKTTGRFTHLTSPNGFVKVGQVAGSVHKHGYICIQLRNRIYRAHRLAWFYVTGQWPVEVDHKNNVRSDNRWRNLREAGGRRGNMENKKVAHKNNKSALLGVSIPKRGRPVARIQHNGVQHTLGYFDTPELAHEAYLKAKRKLHKFNTL